MFPSSTLPTLSYSQGTGRREDGNFSNKSTEFYCPRLGTKARNSNDLSIFYDRQAIHLNNKNIQKPNATFFLRF